MPKFELRNAHISSFDMSGASQAAASEPPPVFVPLPYTTIDPTYTRDGLVFTDDQARVGDLGEPQMKDVDTFQFKSPGTNDDDGGPIYADYTPYDDEIPQEFRVEEPAPPPFDSILPSIYPNNDWAMDLIAWALNDIA